MATSRPAAILHSGLSYVTFSEAAFEQHVGEQAGIIGHDPVTEQFAQSLAFVVKRRKFEAQEECGFEG